MTQQKQKCNHCFGLGYQTRFRSVVDAASVAIFGFPTVRTEQYRQPCGYCRGSGKK